MNLRNPRTPNETINMPSKKKGLSQTRTLSPDSTLSKTSHQSAVVEIRFLALSWLDDFEKEVFDGKTVHELLSKEVYE